jgi:type I restriction enzyme S subunit
MSHSTYLEKLLDGVEVEWKALGGLAENLDSMRKPITSGLREPGTIPYYGASGIVDYVKDYIFDGDFLLVSEDGANLLARNTPIAFSIRGKSWVNNHAHILRFNTYVERRFVDIYLNSVDLTPYISGAAQPKLNQKNLNGIQIPIPCPNNREKSLAIQAEIVRILDAFTELTAELTAELNMRKKQYNYYRDQLLSFEEDEVEWLPMGHKNVGEFIRGGGLQKKDFTETGVGCIHYGQIFTYYGTYTSETKTCVSIEFAKKARKAKSGDLVIATTSENDEDVCKAVAWLGHEDIAVSSDACIYKHKLNPKYVSYFFQTEHFQKQKRQYITGTKVRRVNADNLAKILIPVSAPEEQARIVAILDKFDILTASFQEGLPHEIKLRQKQYEYYRELLLSFPKSEEVAA